MAGPGDREFAISLGMKSSLTESIKSLLTFMPKKGDRDLARLSRFAGRHLAFAARLLSQDGLVYPCGMTRSETVVHGAQENYTMLQTDDPDTFLQMAQHWFSQEHENAVFVSVAIDTFMTVDGVRTSAVWQTSRTADRSARIFVYLPYTSKIENSPIAFGAPQVDFPKESLSLTPKQDFILANVIKGRDSSPLSRKRG